MDRPNFPYLGSESRQGDSRIGRFQHSSHQSTYLASSSEASYRTPPPDAPHDACATSFRFLPPDQAPSVMPAIMKSYAYDVEQESSPKLPEDRSYCPVASPPSLAEAVSTMGNPLVPASLGQPSAKLCSNEILSLPSGGSSANSNVQCRTCSKRFKKPAILKSHMDTHKPHLEMLQCKHAGCLRSFRRPGDRNRHTRSVSFPLNLLKICHCSETYG